MTVEELCLMKGKIAEADRLTAAIDRLNLQIDQLSSEITEFQIRYYINGETGSRWIDRRELGVPMDEFDVIRQKVLSGLLELRDSYVKNLEML